MSEILDDDFTAELKSYFLNNLLVEIEKFSDLIEEANWRKIQNEIYTNLPTWVQDAASNEFPFFSEWLNVFEKQTTIIDEITAFTRALQSLRTYVMSLLEAHQDSKVLALNCSEMLSGEIKSHFLQCSWGAVHFAIPLTNVIEISSGLTPQQLPEKIEGILGVVPFRGEAVPVVNFVQHGFAPCELVRKFYVFCTFEGVPFSLQISGAEDLIQVRGDEIEMMDDHNQLFRSTLSKRFFIRDNCNIMILDMERLFTK